MKRQEESVRVWVVLDTLQAQLMRQMLLENDIECLVDRSTGIIPAGEFGEIGLWVSKKDEARARELLERMEDEMNSQLDRELPDDEDEEPTEGGA